MLKTDGAYECNLRYPRLCAYLDRRRRPVPLRINMFGSFDIAVATKNARTSSKRFVKEKDPFQRDPALSEPTASIGNNRRILVVDDNPVVLKAFELKLKASGFVVTTTPNSGAVAATAERENSELIVLDINFPPDGQMEWNGFSVMQWLRRFPDLAGIPVILITGGDAAQHQEKSLAAGAKAFFQKPVDYKQLLAAITQALAV